MSHHRWGFVCPRFLRHLLLWYTLSHRFSGSLVMAPAPCCEWLRQASRLRSSRMDPPRHAACSSTCTSPRAHASPWARMSLCRTLGVQTIQSHARSTRSFPLRVARLASPRVFGESLRVVSFAVWARFAAPRAPCLPMCFNCWGFHSITHLPAYTRRTGPLESFAPLVTPLWQGSRLARSPPRRGTSLPLLTGRVHRT
jgi:hypothetical protein